MCGPGGCDEDGTVEKPRAEEAGIMVATVVARREAKGEAAAAAAAGRRRRLLRAAAKEEEAARAEKRPAEESMRRRRRWRWQRIATCLKWSELEGEKRGGEREKVGRTGANKSEEKEGCVSCVSNDEDR